MELSLAFIKALLLLSAGAGVQVVLSPPNPPLKKKDKDRNPFEWVVYPILRSFQGLYWLAISLDAATVFASVSPMRNLPIIDHVGSGLLSVCPRSPQILEISVPFSTGVAIIVGAALIRKWCYKALGPMFRGEVAIQPHHKLVTHGPYAWVRHPGYFAALAFFVGSFVVFFARGSYIRDCILSEMFTRLDATAYMAINKIPTALKETNLLERAALIWAVIWLGLIGVMVRVIFTRLDWEDELLRNAFGNQWIEWSKRTPYQVIPYVL